MFCACVRRTPKVTWHQADKRAPQHTCHRDNFYVRHLVRPFVYDGVLSPLLSRSALHPSLHPSLHVTRPGRPPNDGAGDSATVDPMLLMQQWPTVFALLFGLVSFKTIIISSASLGFGLTAPEAAKTGLILSGGVDACVCWVSYAASCACDGCGL